MSAAGARTDHARRLFAGIAGDYDRWAQVLSFGQDARWHRRMIDGLGVGPGDVVVDVATGTGAVAIDIARRYGCRVVGVDQSPEMLATGRRRVSAAGVDGLVDLVEGRAEELPLADGSAAALTHTYLLRYVDDPAATLRELARVLRPGGRMASLEFGVPAGARYALWWAWTRAGLPAAGLAAGPAWYRTGRFLGASIEAFWRRHPVAELVEMWRSAGLERVTVQRLSSGGGVVMRGVRAADRSRPA
jgi:demethylmenaquinone methyltransferase/2-methoxy-6-polyprenyl-1,4-benzoquinol methylase